MKTVKNIFTLTSVMAALLASGHAAAEEEKSADFYVTIRIIPICEVVTSTGNKPTQEATAPSAGADINFGEYESNHKANVDKESEGNSSGAIQVQCTKGTPYKVALTPETDDDNAGGGKMNALNTSNTEKIGYHLFQDAGRAKAWGNQDGNMLEAEGKGFGEKVNHIVYGRVNSDQFDKPAGRYSDKVTVTVKY
ncbi:Csu type fimbrial protein [Neisseria montereyensis]|uniref:Spore coat U domain-containing protein n=1 Tax=Neisseria montereyensis TaxID=2973938 RepID=A0ABT2FBI8_9NEIS|nr:spore coat U domain-containing protein [Neisseria montereyensis]MCS4532920.1 spore coat U domain-containing protein [Neisseria montereyensis]